MSRRSSRRGKGRGIFVLRIHADFYSIAQALRLVDPITSNYLVKWPIYGSNFNTRDYNSIQMLLSDLEALISSTLLENFNIQPSEFKVNSGSIANVQY